MSVDLGPGLQLLERGWLSSNNVLLADGDGFALVDSGHSVHAGQTVALLRGLLGARPLRRLFNTHLHSDHCGGNAALQREWAPEVRVPATSLQAVQRWDERALTYQATGQHCERFGAHGGIAAGERLRIGAREWQALAAPGHDPDSLVLFDAEHRVLISADALWENGFGVVFPELDGVAAFDDVEAVLELIAALPVRSVIPGHGAAFDDVAGALRKARARLDGFRADPARHLRHAGRVLLKYHLMEQRQQPLPDVRAWLRDTPLMHSIRAGLGRPAAGHDAWSEQLLQDMLSGGLLQLRDGIVHDA